MAHPLLLSDALLRDFFAAKLYESAIDSVTSMSEKEATDLARDCGLQPSKNGNYPPYHLDKMFAYKAYQLAECMLEARELVKPK